MQVEKNCEHQAFETAHNAAREMQKQAAKSAESAGKNKGIVMNTNIVIACMAVAIFTPALSLS